MRDGCASGQREWDGRRRPRTAVWRADARCRGEQAVALHRVPRQRHGDSPDHPAGKTLSAAEYEVDDVRPPVLRQRRVNRGASRAWPCRPTARLRIRRRRARSARPMPPVSFASCGWTSADLKLSAIAWVATNKLLFARAQRPDRQRWRRPQTSWARARSTAPRRTRRAASRSRRSFNRQTAGSHGRHARRLESWQVQL